MLFQALIWITNQLKRQYLDHCLYVSDAVSGQLNSSEIWNLWKIVESNLQKRPSNSNKTTMLLFHCLCTWHVVKICYKWLSIWGKFLKAFLIFTDHRDSVLFSRSMSSSADIIPNSLFQVILNSLDLVESLWQTLSIFGIDFKYFWNFW